MPADPRDDASSLHGSDGHAPPSSGTEGLRSVLVRYESGADRRTLYPDEADEYERMTRWISADDGAFVDLDAWR